MHRTDADLACRLASAHAGTLHDERTEAETLHHAHRALFQPEALPVTIVGNVVIAEHDVRWKAVFWPISVQRQRFRPGV